MSPNGIAADASNNVYVADYGAGVVFKLTPPPTITVTSFITINQPVALAYYSGILYVFSVSDGGKAYNVTDNSYANISFGRGYGDYRDVVKPADMVVDNSGNIYVVDMADNYIKKYNSSGVFVEALGGGFPIDNPTSSFGNGKFYIAASIAYDSATNRLFVGDYGNTTPYIQVGSRYNYKTKTTTKSAQLYGRPKGKIQIYNLST